MNKSLEGVVFCYTVICVCLLNHQFELVLQLVYFSAAAVLPGLISDYVEHFVVHVFLDRPLTILLWKMPVFCASKLKVPTSSANAPSLSFNSFED